MVDREARSRIRLELDRAKGIVNGLREILGAHSAALNTEALSDAAYDAVLLGQRLTAIMDDVE
jgi:hypothetical protein